MGDLVQNTLQEYIDLVKRADINIVEGNYNNNYSDDWLSIEYNGYQAKDTYRVKLHSLKVVLEQAIKNRLTYSLDEELNGFAYSLVIDSQADLYPKKWSKSVNGKSPITEKLLFLKDLFSFVNGLYKHLNLNVNKNGAKITVIDKYEIQIADYIEIAYTSLQDLLEIEDNYVMFKRLFIGSDKEKDRNISVLNTILENVGVMDSHGKCLLNNRGGKNNRAILWSIKDVFREKDIFSRSLSDRKYIQTLWKYMDGQEPIPEKRHKLNSDTIKENRANVEMLFSRLTT